MTQRTLPAIGTSTYDVRIAETPADREAALRLRFAVFNKELGEGLERSYRTGRDEDPFDHQCQHLLVIHRPSEEVIGTYRVQSAAVAEAGIGFYSAGEYHLEDLPSDLLSRSLELGRACIRSDHRNRHVLRLLWRGIAAILFSEGHRYLFGCSSLTSQDPAAGRALWESFRRGGTLHPTHRVRAREGFACVGPPAVVAPRVPTLFSSYLRIGTKVVGEPALDREFRTIDFLILLDVEAMDPEILAAYR